MPLGLWRSLLIISDQSGRRTERRFNIAMRELEHNMKEYIFLEYYAEEWYQVSQDQ